MAVAAPGSPWGHPRAAAGGWRWHLSETPGRAMATELGWPGALHSVTVGIGVGPARHKGCQGCPIPRGAAPQGAVLWAGQWWPEHSWHRGMGLQSTWVFSPCSLHPHLLLHLFSSSWPSHFLPLFLLFLSSSSSSHFLSLLLGCLLLLLSSLLLAFTSFSSALFSSWPHHHPLGPFLLSPPVSSAPLR